VDHFAGIRDVLIRDRGEIASQEWVYIVCCWD